jgi:hypothetical protein
MLQLGKKVAGGVPGVVARVEHDFEENGMGERFLGWISEKPR